MAIGEGLTVSTSHIDISKFLTLYLYCVASKNISGVDTGAASLQGTVLVRVVSLSRESWLDCSSE